jgi:CheY-specific phosphatase CheX
VDHDRLAEAFLSASCMAVAEMTVAEVIPRGVGLPLSPRQPGDVCAVLRLTGDVPGTLALVVPAQTAAAFARRILAEVTPEPAADLVADCMAEVANVIAGHSKSLLAEMGCHLVFSTPKLIEPTAAADGECQTIAFSSDLGDFGLVLFRRAQDLANRMSPLH